jgi:hypothetical protein
VYSVGINKRRISDDEGLSEEQGEQGEEHVRKEKVEGKLKTTGLNFRVFPLTPIAYTKYAAPLSAYFEARIASLLPDPSTINVDLYVPVLEAIYAEIQANFSPSTAQGRITSPSGIPIPELLGILLRNMPTDSTEILNDLKAGRFPSLEQVERVSSWTQAELSVFSSSFYELYGVLGKKGLSELVGKGSAARRVLVIIGLYVGMTVEAYRRFQRGHWHLTSRRRIPEKVLHQWLHDLDSYLTHDSTNSSFTVQTSLLPPPSSQSPYLRNDLEMMKKDPEYDPNRSIIAALALIPKEELRAAVRKSEVGKLGTTDDVEALSRAALGVLETFLMERLGLIKPKKLLERLKEKGVSPVKLPKGWMSFNEDSGLFPLSTAAVSLRSFLSHSCTEPLLTMLVS